MTEAYIMTALPEGCLAVVIPCFNEVERIRQCIDRVLDQPIVSEVIVVDDGSTDGTSNILSAFSHESVTVCHHSKNRGKGASVRSGFKLTSAPYVVIQDSDLEQSPSDYSRLIQPLADGEADVVYGSRFPDRRRLQGQYRSHFLANRLLTVLSNAATGLSLTDMETGYKAFRQEVLQNIQIEENRFGIEPELTVKVSRGGWRIKEVRVSYSPRSFEDGKKIGWRDGLRAVYCIVRYSLRYRK
jgi:glycosyltransferase involved in cell wall biosynthesis